MSSPYDCGPSGLGASVAPQKPLKPKVVVFREGTEPVRAKDTEDRMDLGLLALLFVTALIGLSAGLSIGLYIGVHGGAASVVVTEQENQ